MEENLEKDTTPTLLKDLGMRYATENSKRRYRYGLYQCHYCSKEFEAMIYSVKKGHTKSCGCLKYKPQSMLNHPLYGVWSMMKARCLNVNNLQYIYYGARGIKVCDRWLDINNFIEDMYPSYGKGLSLDRVDVNGNYEPDNCRWTTGQIQCRNTRDIMITNTSGFRGVSWNKKKGKWVASITVTNKKIYLGSFKTPLEAAKAYERYVRLNNLEHNFTPALTEEEIEEIKTTRKETR